MIVTIQLNTNIPEDMAVLRSLVIPDLPPEKTSTPIVIPPPEPSAEALRIFSEAMFKFREASIRGRMASAIEAVRCELQFPLALSPVLVDSTVHEWMAPDPSVGEAQRNVAALRYLTGLAAEAAAAAGAPPPAAR